MNGDAIFAWVVLGFAAVVLAVIAVVVQAWRRHGAVHQDGDR